MSAALSIAMNEDTLSRLDAFATERRMTRDAVIQHAVTSLLDFDNGRSGEPLQDWQRHLIDEGSAAADRGDVASAAEVEAVFRKYGG